MEKSYFKATKQEKTYCPKCGREMYKLEDSGRYDSPKFNICFNCKFIGHIGVGIVQVIDQENIIEELAKEWHQKYSNRVLSKSGIELLEKQCESKNVDLVDVIHKIKELD